MQASGEAKYTGDMMLDGSELYAYIVKSERALATITSVDPSAALQVAPHLSPLFYHLFLALAILVSLRLPLQPDGQLP